MELLLLAFFVVVLIVLGIMKLWGWATAGKRALADTSNQVLFMSAALDVNDKLTRALGRKMDARSIEIAQADNRFLVTPADMKQAYEEIIREEHM